MKGRPCQRAKSDKLKFVAPKYQWLPYRNEVSTTR
jgi:hypothetical protein